MKLSQWAKNNGLSYKTAYNLFKQQKLPCKSIQLQTGTILVEDETFSITPLKNYIYCRVSSYSKKSDLDRQALRCQEFCAANGWSIEKTVKEIASGMNDNRKKLSQLLDKTPKRIIIEHKDRLTRFGFNYLYSLLSLLGYEVVVINKEIEDENDLMKDLVSIITSFCCRLYGLRRGKNKTKQIKTIMDRK